MTNKTLEFSWERFDPDTIHIEENSLSPKIENYPITQDEIAEIALQDAHARWLHDVHEGREPFFVVGYTSDVVHDDYHRRPLGLRLVVLTLVLTMVCGLCYWGDATMRVIAETLGVMP